VVFAEAARGLARGDDDVAAGGNADRAAVAADVASAGVDVLAGSQRDVAGGLDGAAELVLNLATAVWVYPAAW
jgi:hypothetical protein